MSAKFRSLCLAAAEYEKSRLLLLHFESLQIWENRHRVPSPSLSAALPLEPSNVGVVRSRVALSPWRRESAPVGPWKRGHQKTSPVWRSWLNRTPGSALRSCCRPFSTTCSSLWNPEEKFNVQSCLQLLGTSPALREEQEGESGVLSGADYAVPDLWIRVSCLPFVSTWWILVLLGE